MEHDPGAFTQGLLFDRGRLYETTGRRGASWLRELDPDSGALLRRAAADPALFGEGATAVDGTLLWLTWTSGRLLRYGLDDFLPRPGARYAGQGWGLAWDGRRLVMSDGSPELTFRDPVSFEPLRRLPVRDGGRPVERLNELEWVRGEIWANVWLTPDVVVIDPHSGRVRLRLDLSELVPQGLVPDAVANGIAWDPGTDRLLLTGKLWPVMYRIAVPDGSAPAAPPAP